MCPGLPQGERTGAPAREGDEGVVVAVPASGEVSTLSGALAREEIGAAIRDAARDPGVRLTLIAGDAGVGKSHLLDAIGSELGATRAWGVPALADVPGSSLAHLVRPTGSHADMVVDLLANARACLAVDDIDQCDALSQALLSRLLREPDRQVIATVRTEDGVLPLAAEALAAEVPTRVVRVPPFTLDETAEVAQQLLGGPPEAALVDELWRRTAGNALFIRQMLEAARARGSITPRAGGWSRLGELPAPVSLRHLLGDRLSELPEQAMRAAQWLSAVARVPVADVELSEHAEGVSVLIQAALARTESADVVLSHPMLAETVWERTDELVRRRMLRDHFDREQARPHPDPLRIAALGLQVGAQVEPVVLLDAARAAAVGEDMRVVARYALAAIDGLAGEERVEAIALYSTVLIELGRAEDAVVLLRAELDRMKPSMEAVILTAVLHEVLVWGMGDQPEAAAMLREQARRYPRWTPLVRQIFGLTEADGLNFTGKPAEALALADSVSGKDGWNILVPLTGMSRPAALIRARAAESRSHALSQLGRTEEAYRIFESPTLADDMAELELLVPTWRGTHHMTQCHALRESGRADSALEAGMRSWEASLESGFFTMRAWAALNVAAVWWQKGDLDQTIRWANRARTAAASCRLEACERLALCLTVLASTTQARPAEAAVVERFDALRHGRGFLWHYLDAAHAWRVHADGRRVEAARILTDAIAVALADGALTAVAFLQHERLRMGDAAGVAESLSSLPQGSPLMAARLAMAHGLESRSADRLAVAADIFIEGGMPLYAAEALSAAARLARGRQAAALEQRARALIAPIGSPRTPLLADALEADALTRREREVAELAARYQSAEIAARLHLSVRTVEQHLHRAYTKLGITSRRELPAALGMVDERRPAS